MSEKPSILKVKTIKADSVIDIQIGTGFYLRLQELLFKHINDNPNENLVQAMENLKTKKANGAYEYSLETLFSLIYEIESKAEAQGLLVDKELDISKV